MSQLKNDTIYVAGHTGMVGQAITKIVPGRLCVPFGRLDLRCQKDVKKYFDMATPTVVLFAAAKVGGIGANVANQAQFLFDNITMAANVIHTAWMCGTVRRFVFLGSSCIYPKNATQPIPESALLSGPLEPTNEGYAIAKIAGVKLCQYYRQKATDGQPPHMLAHSLMPCNLYGPGDNYHPENSHVLAALIHKIHTAKQQQNPSVTIWGTGRPLREFMHVDDLAAAVLHAATIDNPPDWMNVGSGEEISIIDLAKTIAQIVGYRGDIITDISKPDGVKQKLIDSSCMRNTGWSPKISLIDGITATYASYLKELECGELKSK